MLKEDLVTCKSFFDSCMNILHIGSTSTSKRKKITEMNKCLNDSKINCHHTIWQYFTITVFESEMASISSSSYGTTATALSLCCLTYGWIEFGNSHRLYSQYGLKWHLNCPCSTIWCQISVPTLWDQTVWWLALHAGDYTFHLDVFVWWVTECIYGKYTREKKRCIHTSHVLKNSW